MKNNLNFNLNTTADSTTRLSTDLWKCIPIGEIIADPSRGIFFYDDFKDLPLAPTLTTQIGYGKYKAFATTGSSVDRVSPVNSVEILGGALKLATDTDNDSASLASAYPFLLASGLTTNSGPLVFECEIAQKSVVTNMASTIIGLAEVEQWTLATAVPLNASDAPTNSSSFIGFQIKEDGLGTIDTVVSDRATSFTTIGDDEGGTLTAYTFRKLGFRIDPRKTGSDSTKPNDCAVAFYANNQILPTGITRSSLTGYTNLDANGLGLLICTCADSAGTTHEFYMKWWAVGQMYPGQSCPAS